MTPSELAAVAKRVAAELGFDACGVTDLKPNRTRDALDHWLAAGLHGTMRYLERQASRRREPAAVWSAARSVVVVLHTYSTDGRYTTGDCSLAKYAQGTDYHTVTFELLQTLGFEICYRAGSGSFRSYVDSGPLPERELAERSGLGWIAKNTMLIRPGLGSYTFIGCVLTDLELTPDSPFEADRCGSCTRCLDACPTQAFPSPRVLDATRCISYLTIESRDEIPTRYRAAVGDNLFGCDICQDVCPWNVKFAPQTREPRFLPPVPDDRPSLEDILTMDGETFDRVFGHTALERAGLEGLKRNARVVIENRALGDSRQGPAGGPEGYGRP